MSCSAGRVPAPQNIKNTPGEDAQKGLSGIRGDKRRGLRRRTAAAKIQRLREQPGCAAIETILPCSYRLDDNT
jgi:hypothetical protein